MPNTTSILTVSPARQNPPLIIDGTNVIRCAVPGTSASLERLLTVISMIAEDARDFLCIFDANTRYILLQEQSSTHATAYADLLAYQPQYFVECTGGTRADDILLAEADGRGSPIISNDRFKNYASQFGWVNDFERVMRVNQVRDYLHCMGHRAPVVRLQEGMRLFDG